MLTLYYCPNACAGEHPKPEYRAINPLGKVPALRFEDGRVLLESTAILGWIREALLPYNPRDRARAGGIASFVDHAP